MGKRIDKNKSKIIFAECGRCHNKTLESTDYGTGLTSYCYYCKGFFNQEGNFVEDGSAYFDMRYRKGYWSMALLIILTAVVILSVFYKIVPDQYLVAPWWVYSWGVGISVLIYCVVAYFKLKKENYFRG